MQWQQWHIISHDFKCQTCVLIHFDQYNMIAFIFSTQLIKVIAMESHTSVVFEGVRTATYFSSPNTSTRIEGIEISIE